MTESTDEKKKMLEDIFNMFDKDKSGKISTAELKDAVREYYKSLNQSVDDGQIDADVAGIMAECDTTKDNTIDKTEWLKHFGV
jgi:Ca2+-binding EF-hand superfamily protein